MNPAILMTTKKTIIFTLFSALIATLPLLAACESEQQKQARFEREEQRHIEQATYNQYINNSLMTGATPYSHLYGNNTPCTGYGCSEISVKTSSNSDVLVTIKSNGSVVRHAYIRAGDSYAFQMPNGTYQAFFYYGKGWNPEKIMKQTIGEAIKGGFVANETFGKDGPQMLNNSVLTYQLILQRNGNFKTQASNAAEAF